jgi:hypothetical protein
LDNVTYIPEGGETWFGSGLAVLDINLDGVLDLAVGSPSYYIDSPLEYKVCTYNCGLPMWMV